MIRVALSTLTLSALFVSAVSAEGDDKRFRQPSITIIETAARDVVPDVAQIRLAVEVEKPTATAAADEVGDKAKAVLAEMLAKGVQTSDIKSSLTVNAVYDTEFGPQGQALKRKFRAYQATIGFVIRVRDLARTRSIARDLIEKGANRFEGITFGVSEDKSPMDELRVEATKSAARKARLYAEAAGVHLGRVLSIDPNPNEGEADLPRRAVPRNETVKIELPVEPGTEHLFSTVSITWEIVP